MEQARASTSQGLARDFNITPRVHTKGKNKGRPMESVEDAMRREVKEIGLRNQGKTEDKDGNIIDLPAGQRDEGFFAGMRRRGDDRREAARAQREGDAFAPSNIVPEEPVMPEPPTPEAEAAARSDAPLKEKAPPIKFGPETSLPPDTGTVKPQMETATATETEMDPREQFATRMVDEAGYKPGGSRDKAREVALGLFDKPESYEAITTATGSRGYRAKLAQAVAAHHGMTPAQADATVQAAEQGNPDAKEKVEEAVESNGGKAPMIEFGDLSTMQMSEDTHEASWDSLLKGLDIR